VTRRSRMAKDEIELADTVMALKLAFEKLKVRVDYLASALDDLTTAKDAQVPLAAWVDEPLFLPDSQGGEMNPAVPFLAHLHNVRVEAALSKARYSTSDIRTTRDLLATPHHMALRWTNFGKQAMASLVRALERAGVRWPAKGRKV